MKLIVLRHGESLWNHENKFCGWMDIKLSPKGKEEAHFASKLISKYNFHITKMYTSKLSRSIQTGNIILEDLNLLFIPQYKQWELNERHYGSFQGRNRREVLDEIGETEYNYIRRSYEGRPPINKNDESVDWRYDGLSNIPHAESLKDVMNRFIPFIEPLINENSNDNTHDKDNNNNKNDGDILIITHGSIGRSIIKYLTKRNEEEASKIEIPTGIPIVFEIKNGKLVGDYYYLDKELANESIKKYEMKTFGEQSPRQD